ncbi:MAG: FISUMP domain-containing protein [Saprospiraceae bacterium]
MNQQNLKYQLLADLLATLESEEFPIGVGKHLELQQLYSMLPEEISAEEMKTLLAPIFAKNKQDQEFFYDIFDQSLDRVKSKTWKPKDQPTTPILPPKSKWEIITRVLGLTLIIMAAFLAYLRISGDEPLVMPPPCEHRIPLEVEPDSIYTSNLLDNYCKENKLREFLIEGASLEFVSFLNGEIVGEIIGIGTYQIDSNGVFTLKTIEDFEASRETFMVTAIAKYELGTDTTNFFIKQKKEIEEVEQEDTSPKKEYSSLNLEPHPFPKILSFPKQPPLWVSYFQKHKYWIKPILIFLLLALFGAYLNWWAERQQKIIADIQSKNDPPLLWNIQIPNISKINLNEDYFKVLQLMRQRTSDDHYVLNIPQTINKTIEKGGIIDFQYQHKTRPPEYLLLIDRQSSKNHRAYLYNYLFESFKANEVYIERFFFEGDIRLCWNEYYPNGIKLMDLQQTFRDARLIVVGSGYQLLNPVTGKLAKWTRIFDNWSDKAILSPRPTKNWASREKQLKQKFILLPASIQSLTAMVDKMEAIDPDEIKTKINDEVNESIEFREGLIETLQHYFSIKKESKSRDESLVHWIAACAIYPTLHWDLTMYLGQELSTEDNNLLTFDNINQLTRLPWFVEGKIPEQARLELLEYLPEDVELKLRKSLRDLFETIPPPDENSVAFADSRINISLNKYLLEKNNLLKTEIDQYARAGADIDVTMLKYLEGEKSPKDFEVDPNLRKYAEGEKPKIGTDRWTKFLSFLVLMLSIGILFYNPIFEGCEGELIEFKDFELCLATPDEHLSYRAAQIRDFINHNNYKPIDSLEQEAIKKYFLFNSGKRTVAEIGQIQQAGYSVESIMPFVKNDTSILHFYQNLAVDFYNHGVPSYNRFDSLGETVEEYYISSGDSVKFCTAFGEAKFYDNKIVSSGISIELEDILKSKCFVTPVIPNPETAPDPEVLNKTLALKIGGRVFDKKTNERLENVSVQFLGKNIITNSRGRYVHDVPVDDPSKDFVLKYVKENYQEISKKYDRNEITVLEKDKAVEFQLDDIFMEETEIDLACFEKNKRTILDYFSNGSYDEISQAISQVKKCNLGYVQKNEIRKWENQLRDLENQTKNNLACFDENKRFFENYIATKSYDEAITTILKAEQCLEKIPDGILKAEKYSNELIPLFQKVIDEGDALFDEASYPEAYKLYRAASKFVEVQTSQLATKLSTTEAILNEEILLDVRDNQQYRISRLKDNRIWMMQNLNFKAPNSFCVGEYTSNCDKWGRLYPWPVARKACPQGWHLPSESEWTAMINLYGYDAKERYTNLSKIKFTSQLGGYRDNNDKRKYLYVEIAGVVWTSSRDTKVKAHIIDYNVSSKELNLGSRLMTNANSCRCVKDENIKK